MKEKGKETGSSGEDDWIVPSARKTAKAVQAPLVSSLASRVNVLGASSIDPG